MKNQKTAVCECLLRVLSENGIDYELNGEVNIKDVLNKSMLDVVRSEICDGFEEEQIQMSDNAKAKYIGNPTEMKKYVNGLVNNWIRKNKEFNNGNEYVIKNPGSRSGSGDESVKEMRKLLKTVTDPETRASIQTAIDERIAEIAPEKVITINKDALPEHLRNLVK